MSKPAFIKLTLVSVLLLPFYFALAQTKVGEITPNAIKIELSESDQLEEFHEGFAVITKGNSTGIINSEGKFLVPFNKYESTGRFFNGYCMVFKGGTYGSGIIDKNGNEVAACKYYNVGIPDQNGFVTLDSFGAKSIINLKTKKRYTEKNHSFDYHSVDNRFYKNEQMLSIFNGLSVFGDKSSNKWGFMNILQKVVIQPQFDEVEPFSDGMAAVCKTNEYGERKWGFIDTTGNTVIPIQFTNKPHNFYSDRAFVEPKRGSDFGCAYINKSGQIIFKLQTYPITNDFDLNYIFYYEGNDRSVTFLLDTVGNKIPLTTKAIYHQTEYNFNVEKFKIVDGQIKIYGNESSSSQNHGYGLIDLKGNIIMPPIFYELSYFDPVSNLAKATIKTENQKSIEGYINKSGIFVIIKSLSSTW